MEVIKRNGTREEVKLDKIINRIKKQCYELDDKFVDYTKVAITVFNGLYDGVSSKELDQLAAESAAGLTALHPDYSILASRIAVTSLHKYTNKSFSSTMKALHEYVDVKTGQDAGMIDDEILDFILKNKRVLDSAIIQDRDLNFDYFGFKTLEKSYLLKINNQIVERPQHLWMRVSCGIWGKSDNITEVLKTYELLSTGRFTHATPTLFNAGTKHPQLSSCFLLQIADDSLEEIYKILSDVAKISKHAGGIGISISKIRAKGSYIKGTNGVSNGIIPMLKVYNETARYVDQGGGKRKGSFAIYLEPWHADVFDFLDLRKNTGKEELRARDLFLAMWTPDLFMQRVLEDGEWHLMCPAECPGLDEVYGKDFEDLYLDYVSKGKFRRVIKARDLMLKIEESQIETGTPYMLYKDSINIKSNQKNVGVIKSSNLCAEIVEYTSKDEHAVCNLASIALPKCIIDGVFDFHSLYEVTYQAAKNLNQVIDVNYYPTKETKYSNLRHRPIGIGIQGLADVFAILRLPFESDEARMLNREIAETMYYAFLRSSCDSAKIDGPYETYEGSPISQGILQFDMWEEREVGALEGKLGILSRKPVELTSRISGWVDLREDIKKYGVRNSLGICSMPTASTSQILGNNECFEAFTSNIGTRRVLAGEFIVVNKHLVKELISRGLWNNSMKSKIQSSEGSVQGIEEVPQDIKDIFKTAYEIKQRSAIDLSVDRAYFTDQTQSLNLFMKDANYGSLNSALLYGWLKGAKTGCYYIRTGSGAVKANAGLGMVQETLPEEAMGAISCSIDNPDSCEVCGS